MMVREKRDFKALLLKLGVAFALSFAGFVYSRLRSERIKPSVPPPSADNGNEVGVGEGRYGPKDDVHAPRTALRSCGIVAIAEEDHDDTYNQKVYVNDSVVGISSSCDKDGFLLPEFNDIVNEFDKSATTDGISPRKDVETPRSDAETPITLKSLEKDDHEHEIKRLRNMVRVLRERERTLEVQLLEYYGLKEQETAVMELQNSLRINNMEAKFFNLKIESLQTDNRRLEAQMAEHAKTVAELEAARGKIKALKKKLRSDAEHNREQILNLQKRVAKLQDPELKRAASDADTHLKLQKLKELEDEAEELRNSNIRLQLENSELGLRLDTTQILATSILEQAEAGESKEAVECLRHENEDLAKEIEQLQEIRCADVEELVYLRWVNACLRHELRNYQAPSGKTVARDLSKTLSPKSEEKAKQLILEYANTEVMGEKEFNISDIDSEQWSPYQASNITESGEYGDSPATSSTKPKSMNTTKFISKLKKLLRGNNHHHHSKVSSADKMISLEDSSSSISTGIDTVTDGQSTRFTTPARGSSSSFEIPRFRSGKMEDMKDIGTPQRTISDLELTYGYKSSLSGREGSNDSFSEKDQRSDSGEKSDIVKYATVLKHTRDGAVQLHRKSTSYS